MTHNFMKNVTFSAEEKLYCKHAFKIQKYVTQH